MKKKLLTLFFILFSCQFANARVVKFIQATDVHLDKDNYQYLSRFVENINNDFNDIDFVVFTGDNINRAEQKDLCLFLSIIKKLKFKTYVTLGNHDLRHDNSMTNENYMYLVRKNLGRYHSDRANYTFKYGDVVFVVTNGVKEYFPGPNGHFSHDEIVWIDKQLTKYKDKKVVILQHFPLIDSKHVTASLYNKQEYMEMLNKHNNVIAVVSGHYHENKELKQDGIYHIMTARFKKNENYKVIEIDDKDGYVFTSLIENKE